MGISFRWLGYLSLITSFNKINVTSFAETTTYTHYSSVPQMYLHVKVPCLNMVCVRATI